MTPRPTGPGARIGLADDDFRALLERLRAAFGSGHLDSDPVGLVRRYDLPEDREIVGLVAAGLAYGRVASIRESLSRSLAILGRRPRRFLESFDPRRDARRFDGLVHRFTRGRDVAFLLALSSRAIAREGSLEAFFRTGDPGGATIEGALDAFGRRLFDLDPRPFVPAGPIPRDDRVRWLLPVPRNGSACKRSCLWLRWMGRPDDGVDCGAWESLDPSRLVVPLDVHIGRIALALGWTRRRTADWKSALEVTACLGRLAPADPTRYDFALSRLGILGRMRAPSRRIGPSRVREVIDGVLEESAVAATR